MVDGYILLMRHGKIDRDCDGPDAIRPLHEAGRREAREVSDAFAEFLLEHNPPSGPALCLGEIWHSGTSYALENARSILTELEARGITGIVSCEHPELDPRKYGPYRDSQTPRGLADALDRRLVEFQRARGTAAGPGCDDRPPNAVLIIGNQPLLGWLAFELTGDPLPLGRSELACLATRRKKRLRNLVAWVTISGRKRGGWYHQWSLEPTDQETLLALKEKIKSKMDLAKNLSEVIGSILGLGLGALVATDAWSKLSAAAVRALYTSVGFFFLALLSSLATMYAYDRLSMPERFWTSVSPARPRTEDLVWRPPSSSSWVLFQNMTRVWNRVFVPATLFVVLGLLPLAYAAFHLDGSGSNEPGLHPALFFGPVLLVLALLYRVYYTWVRPDLGTPD